MRSLVFGQSDRNVSSDSMLQKTLLKLFPDVGVVLISRNGNEENGHGPDGVDDGVEGVITS